MTKRAFGKFPRRKLDQYDTPETAVYPLFPHLPKVDFNVWEPCAGACSLAFALSSYPHCDIITVTDVEPRHSAVVQMNALDATMLPRGSSLIITNPPWERGILHKMIEHFRKMVPTWLLIDANWMHTKQASEHLEYCAKIVAIGRVSWMENDRGGFDDSCWYLFESDRTKTTFHGRN